jgi:hypothetical protein
MRVRPVPLIAGVFCAAALATAFVVPQVLRPRTPLLRDRGGPAPAAAAEAPAPPGRSAAREGTGVLEGTVRDPAGRALAGVRVRAALREDGLPPPAGRAAGSARETRTGFDGAWRIEGVEAGRVEIVAREDGSSVGAARFVRVAAGRATGVDLVLPALGFVEGRVRERGRPAGGARVHASARTALLGGFDAAGAPADASGRYAFALPAGEYRIHASPGQGDGPRARATPAFVRVEPGRTSVQDLSVAAAAEAPGLEILVLEPGGAPSPGAVVTLARPEGGTIALAAPADETGRLALDREMGMTGRRVAVRARNGGRTGESILALPPSGTVRIALGPAGAVEGIARGGRAPAGLTVEVASRPDGGAWRTVEVHRFPGDRFALDDLPPEPLRLVVRASDGRTGEAEVRLAPGEVRRLEIALRP